MVSISIIALPDWGNLLSHCQAPLDPLRRIGEVWQCAWSSPYLRMASPGSCPCPPWVSHEAPTPDAHSPPPRTPCQNFLSISVHRSQSSRISVRPSHRPLVCHALEGYPAAVWPGDSSPSCISGKVDFNTSGKDVVSRFAPRGGTGA